MQESVGPVMDAMVQSFIVTNECLGEYRLCEVLCFLSM